MEPQKNERLPLELTSQLVAIMTTEHYTLQTGRSMTIAEANGREIGRACVGKECRSRWSPYH